VQYGKQLVDLVNSTSNSATVQTRVEASAYFLILRGDLSFERSQWSSGLDLLSVVRDLLTHISQCSPTAHGQALANEWLDDVEPIARYCAYQLGIQGNIVDITLGRVAEAKGKVLDGYDALVGELRASRSLDETVKGVADISWRGRTINVRNVELADVTSRVEAALTSLDVDQPESAEPKRVRSKVLDQRGRPARFDKALATLREAEDVSRRLVEDNQVRNFVTYFHTCR
jgi:hypothetical protein